MLDHEFGHSNKNEENNEIEIDILLDYNESKYKVIRVFNNKIVVKAIVNRIEIEFIDLEFVLNACNK